MELNHKKSLKVPENLKKRKNNLFLVFIVVAFYLRLQGINYGLPYVLNPDESANLIKMLSFCRIFFKYFANPECINISPVFLFFNSLVVYITCHTFNTNILINLLEINPGAFFIPLRFISVLFGVGTVIVIYFIGLRFSPLVAIIAGGLLSVSMPHVKFSQIFLPFSAMTFFCLLSGFFILKTNISNKEITLSAISALLSFLMHPIGIISVIPLLIILFQEKSLLKFKPLFTKLIVISLLLSLNYLFHLPSIVITLVKNYLINYYNYHSSSYFLYAFSFLFAGIGPVAYFGAIGFLKYRKDYNLNLLKILFSLPVLYVGVISFLHMTEAGYIMILIPYFCISAGLFFNSIYERANTDNKKFIFILLLLFLFWIPLKYTLKYNKIITLPDTRVVATEWIKQNTSENYRIAWDKNSIQPNWHDVYDKQELKYLVADPELLINRQRFPVSLKLLEKNDWFKVLKKKVDYIVVNSLDYEQVLRRPGENLEKKYYKKILKLKPILVFNPYLKELDKNTKSLLIEDLYSPFLTLWQRERSGPVIKIYKL